MVADVHAHIIVRQILRDAAPEETWRPRVWWEQGQQVVETAGRQMRAAVGEFVDVAAILRAQQARGVDRVVLCPWVGLLRYDADPADARVTARVQNEALADLVRAFPRRIRALGTVPLQDPGSAAREVRSVMGDLRLSGVEIAASVRGVYLGDDWFRPFWEAAEEAGALVFIHPTTRGFDQAAFNDYYLWNAVGNPLETTITAAHMVMAGVMEAHPQLKVLLAHGGGALPALRGRLRHAYRTVAPARARLRHDPEESIRRFYFDTVVHDGRVLRSLVEFVGAGHVVLGSDYPFDMGADRPVEAVRALELPPADETAILEGNALTLLGEQKTGTGNGERETGGHGRHI